MAIIIKWNPAEDMHLFVLCFFLLLSLLASVCDVFSTPAVRHDDTGCFRTEQWYNVSDGALVYVFIRDEL